MGQEFFNPVTQLGAVVEAPLPDLAIVEVYDFAKPVTPTPASVPGMDEFAMVREVTFRSVDAALHYAQTVILARSLTV